MSGCLTVMLCLSLLLSGCAPAESEGENSLLPPEVVEAFQPEPLGTGEITYETGAESLSADQEALLLDYFTRSYEALARLEEADFTDLFSDDTQARISSAEIDLQAGMRTMIDGLDYSLTGYQYTILCRGVTAQEDGSVAVDAMERSAPKLCPAAGDHLRAVPDLPPLRAGAAKRGLDYPQPHAVQRPLRPADGPGGGHGRGGAGGLSGGS